MAGCWQPTASTFLSLELAFFRFLLQGVVVHLLEDILSVFPREWIFTTEDKAAWGDEWPSQQQVRAAG